MIIDETRITAGIFQQELKNRFRCVVTIDGKDELCYVPSSCRLSNFIDLNGESVLLTPSINSVTLPLTLFATAEKRKATILNLSIANEAVFEALKGRRFSFLGKRKSIRREVLLNGYKADIYIEDTRTAMEIKTIISSEKTRYSHQSNLSEGCGNLSTSTGFFRRATRFATLLFHLAQT